MEIDDSENFSNLVSIEIKKKNTFTVQLKPNNVICICVLKQQKILLDNVTSSKIIIAL